MLFETQVERLFIELGIDFLNFYKTANKYKKCTLGRYYNYSDVANYIDIQLHLKHSQN